MDTYDKIPDEFSFLEEKIPRKLPSVGEKCSKSHCDGKIKLVDRGSDLPDKMDMSDINGETDEGGRFCIACSNNISHNHKQCNFRMNLSNIIF